MRANRRAHISNVEEHEVLAARFEATLAAYWPRAQRRTSRPLARGVLQTARVAARLGCPLTARARTFWGGSIRVMLPEYVSSTIYLWRFWEPGLTSALIRYLRPGMAFFDVGAHVGYYSLLAARLVGPGGKVHAFEPTPRTFALLRRNAAPARSVECFPLALYSSTGELVLRDFGAGHSAQNTVADAGRFGDAAAPDATLVRIPAISLDDHVERTGVTPDFVKIDAESAEYQILQGMEKTIVRRRPIISIEVGDEGVPGVHPSVRLVEHLEARGYAAWEWTRAGFARHEPRATYDLDNLLFIPAG